MTSDLRCSADDLVNVIVDGGAVPALLTHLQAPPYSDVEMAQKPFEHEVEKGSAFALGLLAIKVLIFISSCSATCIVC